MERLDLFSGSFCSVFANDLNFLASTGNLSGTQLNLHVTFCNSDHGRSERTATRLLVLLRIAVIGCVSMIAVGSLGGLLEFSDQGCITFEVGGQIEPHDRVGRNVRSLIFKSSVHVKRLVVLGPNGVSEPLDRVEFLPF